MKKLAALLLTTLLTTAPSIAHAQSLPQATRERIIKATVMLMKTGRDGKLDGTLGSGTIISSAGYILTNYHVVGDIDSREVSEWIAVRVVKFVDQEPVPAYWGQVVAADPNLDLAIVKIVEDKDQKPVSNLNLPFVQLGDSNKLMIGDPLHVFGFQGTGGMTLTYSQGSVGGFTGDDLQSSGRQWVKHDAQSGPGNSGGGAYDASGDLIGVHSAGLAGNNNSRTSFMRPLAVAWGLITPNVPKFVVRPGSSTVTTATKSQTTSTSATNKPTEQTSVGTWPPNPATGQTWRIALKSDDLEEIWQLKMTGKTQKGTPKGTASNGSRQTEALLYYVAKDDILWFDLPAKGEDDFYSCRFKRSGVEPELWLGELLYYQNSDSDGDLIGACGVLSGAGGTAKPGATQTSTAQSSTTQASATQTSTASKPLAWPVRPQPGQNWQFSVGKFGTVTVNLTGKNKNGLASGTALINGKTKVDALFYHEDKEATTWLDLYDGESLLYCAFKKDDLKGNTLSGRAYYKENAESGGDAENVGTCTGQLK